jgi:hypothetical protein
LVKVGQVKHTVALVLLHMDDSMIDTFGHAENGDME